MHYYAQSGGGRQHFLLGNLGSLTYIKYYTHATAVVQTSEHCSFPNYSTHCTTAQSIVPSRIIPCIFVPPDNQSCHLYVCVAHYDFLRVPIYIPAIDATLLFDQIALYCMQTTNYSSYSSTAAGFVEDGAKLLFSDILSCHPIRVRDELHFYMVFCPLDPWTLTHEHSELVTVNLRQYVQ